MKLESDEELRERLIQLCPPGAWYTAEDIGNASGKELDAIAVGLETQRQEDKR